jgi:hypothetical protein
MGRNTPTNHRGVRRLCSTIDQIVLVVDSSTGVVRYGYVRGRAPSGRAIGYADRRVWRYIRTVERAISDMDRTGDKVIHVLDRGAGITRDGFVCRLACYSFVWAVWDADRGVWPYICTIEEPIGGLDRPGCEVALGFNGRAGFTPNGYVGRHAGWSLVWAVRDADRRVWPYIPTVEEPIGDLDCTGDEVIFVFDRRAGITWDGRVGRFARWSFVWPVGNADGGIGPDIIAIQELIGLLDGPTHKVILPVEFVTGIPFD